MPSPRRQAVPVAIVHVRPVARVDRDAFIDAAMSSRRLHGRWVRAPSNVAEFAAYVRRYASRKRLPTHRGLLAVLDDGTPVGVFNFSNIVMGSFRSAYLGYYGMASHTGRGLMTQAFAQVLDYAFGTLGLHRVEANVQPTNARSIALVERVGFTREGYSRRYIKISGRWRDHVRFAMLVEDWRTRHSPKRRTAARRAGRRT
jgi:ribosomal-protein-alanine N-acetyltransferase